MNLTYKKMEENLLIKSPEQMFSENNRRMITINKANNTLNVMFKCVAIGLVLLAVSSVVTKRIINQIKINNYENTNSK